jgi:DNA-binding PadR family transcriptional regulator
MFIEISDTMTSTESPKGLLRSLALIVIEEDGPQHGYAIAKRIETASGGLIKPHRSSLYLLLHKLKREKLVVTAADITTRQLRIHYALTPKGHSVAVSKIKELRDFSVTLRKIIHFKQAKK